MNIENNASDLQMTDEELQYKYEIRPSYVFVPRLSESIFLNSGGNIRPKSPDFVQSLLVASRLSDDESDASTIALDTSSEPIKRVNLNVDDSSDEDEKTKDRLFSIHYGRLFLEEVARNIYDLYSWNFPVKLKAVYKVIDSKFCTLTEKDFRKTVLEYIETLVCESVMSELETKFISAAETLLKKVVRDLMNAMSSFENRCEETPHSAKVSAFLARMVINSRSQFDAITRLIYGTARSTKRKLIYHENEFIIVPFVKALFYKEAVRNAVTCKVVIKPSDVSAVTAYEHYMSFRKKFYKNRGRFNC